MKIRISHHDLLDLMNQLDAVLDKATRELHRSDLQYEYFVIDLDGYQLQFSMKKGGR